MSTRNLPEQIGDLPKIGRPAASALREINVTTMKRVSQMSDEELLALHGFGPKALRILREEQNASNRTS
ncbi:hypothetical protein [uncultured Agrococcus sp.]|uniref:hypothetical protein n=1 Tax=uncultured Agrococcus sp. TaxID=382258 RepID=UPI0025D0D09F|nr:hypothetical protein [uncultured Agrococcus sp.]